MFSTKTRARQGLEGRGRFRTQSGTEGCTEEHREGLPVYLEITKDMKDTKSRDKGRRRGAGRACAQGTRPARGPEGAWRASHATFLVERTASVGKPQMFRRFARKTFGNTDLAD